MEQLSLVVLLGVFIFCTILYYDKQRYIAWVFVIEIIIIMGLVSTCPDYGAYYSYYNFADRFDIANFDSVAANYYGISSDAGYMALNAVFHSLGLSYEEFRLLTTAMFLLPCAVILYKETKNVSFVLAMYCVYPLAWDICQVRNYMAEMIIFVGIYFAAKYYRKKYIVLIITFLLAALLHKSAILYVPVVLLALARKIAIGRIVYSGFLFIGFLMPLYEPQIISQISILRYALFDTDNFANFGAYATDAVRYGYLDTYIKLVAMILTIYVIRRYYHQHEISECLATRYTEILYRLIQYMIILSPIIAIDGTMFRYPRNLMLPIYLLCALYLDRLQKWPRIIRQTALVVVFFAVMVADSYSEFYMFQTVLNNNYFYDMLDF